MANSKPLKFPTFEEIGEVKKIPDSVILKLLMEVGKIVISLAATSRLTPYKKGVQWPRSYGSRLGEPALSTPLNPRRS